MHEDHDDGYSLLVAVTDRNFHFAHMPEPVKLCAGQYLLFRANLCHWGAGLSKAASSPSLALHIAGGTKIDPETIGKKLKQCA